MFPLATSRHVHRASAPQTTWHASRFANASRRGAGHSEARSVVAANALAVVLLARVWSHAEGIAAVAGFNLLAGAIALLLARRRTEQLVRTPGSKDHDTATANGEVA